MKSTSRRPLLIVTALLLSLTVLSISSIPRSYAASTVDTTTLYIHHDAGANLLNSGIVANSTQKWEASADTAQDATTTSSSQMTWASYYEYNTAGPLNIYGTITFNVYISANQSLTGVTLGAQVNEVPVSPSNGNVTQGNLGSETALFGGEQTTTINPTTTITKYSVTLTASSVTTIPSDYTLHLIVYVNPGTTHPYTFTIYFDSSAEPTNVQIPLSTAPVTVNSLTLSPADIQGTGASTATVSVSDAFGLYDITSQAITVSIPGTSAYPISASSMTASSSNTPTSYTGTYTYSINPSSTSYTGFAGTWAAQSTVTDNSGNAYTSLLANFNYSPGGSCLSCTLSTTSSHSIAIQWNLTSTQELELVGAIVTILAVTAIVIAKRS